MWDAKLNIKRKETKLKYCKVTAVIKFLYGSVTRVKNSKYISKIQAVKA